jgi:lysophospholipase L1-like esterase
VIRRYSVAIAAAAAVSCFALAPVTPAHGAVQASWTVWGTPRPGSTYSLASRLPALAGESGRPRGPLAGCEQQLEHGHGGHGRGGHGHGGPAVVIVGASFTAGVGSGSPGKSWAVALARLLHWDAVIYGDPGAGYVRAGAGRKGPVAAEIARVDLRALGPALVIVQAGHDDIGVPARLEQRRVEQAVALIRAEAPRARIALLTVFAGRSRSPAAYRTDQTIVTAGRAADPNVIIMDPLAGGWMFPRSHDGLHPTAQGSAWIARAVAEILREHGVRPASPPPDAAGAIICDADTPVPAR